MGVPQGSILGPILFITYINSLLKLNIDGEPVAYADDTGVIFKGDTWEEVRDRVKSGLNQIMHWLETFKLSLNIQKTNYIAFTPINLNRPGYNKIYLKMDEPISSCDKTKYLGIIIDKHMKWIDQISFVVTKIRKLVYKFYILREILSEKLSILVYRALVESLLRYGIIAWGGMYKTNLRPLQTVQNIISLK